MRRSTLIRRARGLGSVDLTLAGYAGACLLLGGASAAGAIANGLLQLAAVAILAWLALTPAPVLAPKPSRLFWGLLAGLGAVAALQLLPLPPAIWGALPGRAPILAEYRLLGAPLPWLTLSLTPDRAVASLLALLPFLATLFLTMRSTTEGRVAAAWVAISVAAASIAVGSVQLFSGGASRLYLYQITNRGDAVGFFANRNHLATLFLMVLPFVAALAARDAQSGKREVARRRPLYVGTFLFLTFGAALNGSSAGLALLGPCVAASALIFLRGVGRTVPTRYVAGGAAAMLAVLLFVSVGPYHGRFLDKAISGGNSATRGTSISLTAHAARDFLPLDSGVGSFRHIYTRYENLQTLNNQFVNHAHDDWVEITLETGVMGLALLVGLCVWLAIQARASWSGAARAGSLARAGLTAIVLLLLHSLVDYPARTAAILWMAGWAIGIVATPTPTARATPAPSPTEPGAEAPAARTFVAD